MIIPIISKILKIIYAAAAIFGLLCSIVFLYQFLSSKEATIVAIANVSNFQLPPEASSIIDSLENETKYQLKNAIDYKQYLEIVITNTGNKQANEVTLSLPFDGVYSLTSNGKSENREFNKSINIGPLKPLQSNFLEIWLKYNLFSSYYENKCILTHVDGIGKIHFGKTFYGNSKTIADLYSFSQDSPTWLKTLWILLLILMLIPIILSSREMKASKNIKREISSNIVNSDDSKTS